MSTSPIPQDPYEVLGVTKNCDLDTVRKAHRKLVLKFHPDRIKDPALQEQGKNEFQKVQQAYELLIDPSKRARYDDKVKLAELRRERMMSNDNMSSARSTFTTTTYTARPVPTSTPSARREMRSDGKFYEERSPESYFDPRSARDRYDEPPSRGTARKADYYEKRPSSSRSSDKKEKEKTRSAWGDGHVKGVSSKIASNLKKKATAAKDRVREEQARTAKTRGKEEQRARSEKQANFRARVDEYSDSDSDTVVPRQPAAREPTIPIRTRGPSSPDPIKLRPPPPPRSRSYEEDDDSEEDGEKWERHHQDSRAYIAESQKRPHMTRSGSNAHVYWETDVLRDRRSGSDSDRRPGSSSKTSRRSTGAERARPGMPTQNSAPSNLKPNFVDREPPRSQTSHQEPRVVPGLHRAQTTPIPKSRKESGNFSRGGSNLKHGETVHDSGYGSSSSPHTPEMTSESPPPMRESQRGQRSTKYTIVDPPTDDDGRKPATRLSNEEERPRRYRSPDPIETRRDARERPTRPRVDTDARPRSSRAAYSPLERGSNFQTSPRDSPPVSRHNSGKLFGESPPEPDFYSRRADPTKVRYASYRTPEDYDGVPGSHFRYPNMGSRRPSVQA